MMMVVMMLLVMVKHEETATEIWKYCPINKH